MGAMQAIHLLTRECRLENRTQLLNMDARDIDHLRLHLHTLRGEYRISFERNGDLCHRAPSCQRSSRSCNRLQ
eukprot:6274644-Pyramimonas_sp.AAC.1